MSELKAEKRKNETELPLEAKELINYIHLKFRSPSFAEEKYKVEVIKCVQDYLTIEEMLTTGKRVLLIDNTPEQAKDTEQKADKDKGAPATEDAKAKSEEAGAGSETSIKP